MLRFVDLEDDQGPDETLLAGIKPMPINRMVRQAGREANDFEGAAMEDSPGAETGKLFKAALKAEKSLCAETTDTTARLQISPR